MVLSRAQLNPSWEPKTEVSAGSQRARIVGTMLLLKCKDQFLNTHPKAVEGQKLLVMLGRRVKSVGHE